MRTRIEKHLRRYKQTGYVDFKPRFQHTMGEKEETLFESTLSKFLGKEN